METNQSTKKKGNTPEEIRASIEDALKTLTRTSRPSLINKLLDTCLAGNKKLEKMGLLRVPLISPQKKENDPETVSEKKHESTNPPSKETGKHLEKPTT